ncbi:AEC family transporter [Neptunomonas japonica]|uniref:AEC family transporter n=1 Tax=Neptunomonas japonica TaxID=417574 RepID=UPI000423656A|nr:AEC family transporter [Neptunomonas japonica]
MLSVLSALWPVFAILILGFVGRRAGFPGNGFWEPAEKLTYFVLFPVLLINKLGSADITGVSILDISIAVVALLLIGTGLCFVVRYWMGLSAAGFTSFYQGSVRFNTYVGLASVSTLYGNEAVAVSAVVIAFMIPLLNLLSIIVFSTQLGRKQGVRGLLATLIKNPLILSCLLGIGLNISGIGIPSAVASVTGLLGSMALPLGLLAVGAGLNLHALRVVQSAVWVSSFIKLLLFPFIMYGICFFMELSSFITGLLLVFAAVPTAPSAFILARQLGGDAEMMAAIITGQVLLSMLTLPIVLGMLI